MDTDLLKAFDHPLIKHVFEPLIGELKLIDNSDGSEIASFEFFGHKIESDFFNNTNYDVRALSIHRLGGFYNLSDSISFLDKILNRNLMNFSVRFESGTSSYEILKYIIGSKIYLSREEIKSILVDHIKAIAESSIHFMKIEIDRILQQEQDSKSREIYLRDNPPVTLVTISKQIKDLKFYMENNYGM
jgi:hypothetical protein